MIELFAIFGKGGIVLWCFTEGSEYFKDVINELITTVLLQERNVSSFSRQGLTIKYKLDNEFDIIILVVYQSIIQLSYADKLLTETHIRFRDLYKNVLTDGQYLLSGPRSFKGFSNEFNKIINSVKHSVSTNESVKPRTFQESDKSKKTIASMIETAADRAAAKAKAVKDAKKPKKGGSTNRIAGGDTQSSIESTPHNSPRDLRQKPAAVVDEIDEEILRNRTNFFQKKKGAVKTIKKEHSEQAPAALKKGKQARKWDLAGNEKDLPILDYSNEPTDTTANNNNNSNGDSHENGKFFGGGNASNFYEQNIEFVGKLKGDLPGLDEGEDILENLVEANDESDEDEYNNKNNGTNANKKAGGWFSSFRSLVGNKQLSHEDLEPVLEKMKENLISKNVAAEPAEKICESVGAKLEGKIVGTFSRIASIVREAMRDALIQLLTPKRRVDILRDIMEAKAQNRPYVIVFCGVNGVGKSTNLAKITFWLNENNHQVLIAAGDTFRAGAVEQLRTHTRHLNALHPQGVQLYEQGYGKDPAGLAAAAVQIAMERKIDVVLVDTAGRMQDNEPLMRALSKLIRLNEPDLVLFVGEALVGNEAVDQLVKFNQALADNSAIDATARLIDGIVLTKFDTIDDKVGAAISMTYITGQPIVFVGTGQSYKDLKSLNVNTVVNSLLK